MSFALRFVAALSSFARRAHFRHRQTTDPNCGNSTWAKFDDIVDRANAMGFSVILRLDNPPAQGAQTVEQILRIASLAKERGQRSGG